MEKLIFLDGIPTQRERTTPNKRLLASVLLAWAWQWQCPHSLPIFCFDNPETDVITASACLHLARCWLHKDVTNTRQKGPGVGFITIFAQQSGSPMCNGLVPRKGPGQIQPRLGEMLVSRRPGDDWSKADWEEAGQPLLRPGLARYWASLGRHRTQNSDQRQAPTERREGRHNIAGLVSKFERYHTLTKDRYMYVTKESKDVYQKE